MILNQFHSFAYQNLKGQQQLQSVSRTFSGVGNEMNDIYTWISFRCILPSDVLGNEFTNTTSLGNWYSANLFSNRRFTWALVIVLPVFN